MKRDLRELDFIRWIAVVSIILIHVSGRYVEYKTAGFLLNQLVRFAVPAFVILSGYLLRYRYSPENDLSFNIYIKRRFNKILIPYFCWTVIYLVFGSSRPVMDEFNLAALQQLTGINTVIYYAPSIFQLAGFQSASSSILATAGVGAVNLLFTVVARLLVDRVGRRPLLFVGMTGMVVCLALLGVVFLGSMLAYPIIVALRATPFFREGRENAAGLAASGLCAFVLVWTVIRMIEYVVSGNGYSDPALFAAVAVAAVAARLLEEGERCEDQ
jgi:fucose 4-O-acetylase-like acetyltransferase